MTRVDAVLAVLLIVALAAACEPYTVTHPGEYNSGGTPAPRIATTYEAWWAGQYDGFGAVRLLTTGDDYSHVTACLNLWTDDTHLHADAYVRLLSSPLEFKELSDGTYSGGKPSGCAVDEGGVLFETSSTVSSVTSKDTVLASNSEVSFFGLERRVILQVENRGSEFLAKMVVSREDPLCAAGTRCSWIEAAKLTFAMSKTN